jgi:uncharacterized protein (DUF2252 family)
MTSRPLDAVQRQASGKTLRDRVSRSAHQEWQAAPDRDPIAILEASNQGRIPDLIPLRYSRMLANPFTFLRGSAAIMAADLATTPTTGITLQACGDAHLSNFGLYASPERNLVFDLNDFDETLPAPWEWDIKRLATSVVVAGRTNGLSDREAFAAVMACVQTYRERLQEFAQMSPLEIWYYRLDAKDLMEQLDEGSYQTRKQILKKALKRNDETLFPKLTEFVDGRYKIEEEPLAFVHTHKAALVDQVQTILHNYCDSLRDDHRHLLDRYYLEDFAVKVVGIGSVGTRCYIALLLSEDCQPLFLQFKEARQSVLEPYTSKSVYANQGQRIVAGQRLMQATSDLFLGWMRSSSGHDFYVRRLRDMKYALAIDKMSASKLKQYAELCAWSLARAHAKSGDAAMLSGYLGKSDTFDRAIQTFARLYADQTEQDYTALVNAAKQGQIDASVAEPLGEEAVLEAVSQP